MAQQLRTLPENPRVIPSTHMQMVTRLMPPSDLCGHQASMQCTCIHSEKILIHIKINTSNKVENSRRHPKWTSRLYINTHTHIICTHTHTCTHAYATHKRVYAHVKSRHVCSHTLIVKQRHVYVHTHIKTQTYVYTHTTKHNYTCTPKYKKDRKLYKVTVKFYPSRSCLLHIQA